MGALLSGKSPNALFSLNFRIVLVSVLTLREFGKVYRLMIRLQIKTLLIDKTPSNNILTSKDPRV